MRTECLNGAVVAAVMRDTGLTHGGFYKHFESKDDLLFESLSEAFRDIGGTLIEWPNSRTVKPRGRRL